MLVDEELYLKFPTVLRNKILTKEIKLPDSTKFSYSPLYTYRAVERAEDDTREVTREDFKSYFELGKEPKNKKKPRENPVDITKDPHFYGVSSFLRRDIVELIMKFPNPKKKLAAGYVYSEGGPQNTVDEHVCWWLYEDTIVSGFKLLEEKNDE